MKNSDGQITLVDLKQRKTVSGQIPLNICLVSQWRFDDLRRMPGKPISEARKLAKEVQKVVFVCYNEQNRFLSRRVASNMYVYTMPLCMSYSLTNTLANLPKNLVTAGLYLSRIINLHSIDFIRADNIILGGIPTLIASRLKKTPFAIWLAGSEESVIGVRYNRSRLTKVVQSIFTLIKKIVLNQSRFILSVSEELKMSEAALTKTPIIITPNFVNLDDFKPENSIDSDEKLRVLYVGRLETEKGIKYLLEAFRGLDSDNEISLKFAGFGTQQGLIEEESRKNQSIKYLGMFSHDEMPKIYQNVDVLVIPSLTEGMPAAILEALSSGIPVIATRVGQIPNVIREGIEGLLVNPGSALEIRDAILKLSRNRQMLNRLKNAARSRAISISGNYIRFHREIYNRFLLQDSEQI